MRSTHAAGGVPRSRDCLAETSRVGDIITLRRGVPGGRPLTIEDAACMSFRALRFAQGKRSEESERVAHDPSRCSG